MRCGFAVPGGYKNAHAGWCEKRAKRLEEQHAQKQAEDMLTTIDENGLSQPPTPNKAKAMFLAAIHDGIVQRLRDCEIERVIETLETKAAYAAADERGSILQCVKWIREIR
jgi:hypothetical protein